MKIKFAFVDCAGIPNGPSVEDICGVCNGKCPPNDGTSRTSRRLLFGRGAYDCCDQVGISLCQNFASVLIGIIVLDSCGFPVLNINGLLRILDIFP